MRKTDQLFLRSPVRIHEGWASVEINLSEPVLFRGLEHPGPLALDRVENRQAFEAKRPPAAQSVQQQARPRNFQIDGKLEYLKPEFQMCHRSPSIARTLWVSTFVDFVHGLERLGFLIRPCDIAR